ARAAALARSLRCYISARTSLGLRTEIMAADDCGSPRPHAGATEDTPKLQGDLAGKMSVYDVVELLLSCDEMVGSAAGIPDEIKYAMREDP
ncbi:hypothetical protein PF011_g31607, partial [Phytophthora fragariae]